MSETKPPKVANGVVPKYMKFIFGGTAGMTATLFVQPLDLVKNRMQMSGEGGAAKAYNNTFHALSSIIRKEGVFRLYNGLSAGLLRQATYSTTRLGVYTNLFERCSANNSAPPSLLTKIGIGLVSGISGAFVGTPTEVCLIRMTSDGRLPVNERRNYANVFNALYRIVREEGVTALWRGAIPTMGRSAVVNAAQLASYSHVKQLILQTEAINDGIFVHLLASMTSGLITTIASLPVDIAKTRIQNMRTINGKPEYSGMLDVIMRVVRNEGVPALWKGFTPYLFRLGPHTVLTFIALEQLNKAYHIYVLQESSAKTGTGL